MKDHEFENSLRAAAAAYALGTLDEAERAEFERRLEDGCEISHAELAAFAEVTDALSGVADPVAPPDALRDRVLTGSISSSGMHVAGANSGRALPMADIVRAGDVEWEPFAPGVRVKTLNPSGDDGRITQIVEMAPGVSMPAHRHIADEEVYILSGDCHVAPGVVLGVGDYFRADAATDHEYTYTEQGTTFLAIYSNGPISD